MEKSAPCASMAWPAASRIRAIASSSVAGLGEFRDVRDLVGDLVEDQLDLHAGQVCPDAVVRTVAAETQVRVGVSADVKSKWVSEDLFVVVGGTVEQACALALADGDTTEFGVGQRCSLEAVHGRGPADDFVCGG